MSTDTVKVEVSDGLIRPIIESKIQAAIVAELGKDPAVVIDALVRQSLGVKTDERGKISRYESDNKYTYLSSVVSVIIREETKKALNELMEENRDKIKTAIKKQLAQSTKADKLAGAILEGMTESLKCKYSNKIDVTFQTPEER